MKYHTKESLIAFESHVKELWEAGELPYLLHLCGGNEEQLIEIFSHVEPGDWVFSSHRNHYHALLSGMNPDALEHQIRSGNSMFVFGSPQDERFKTPVHFLTSSILAGTCCIAAGVAHRIKHEWRGDSAVRPPHVWCFLGDGAEDEGHFYEAVRFVDGHRLPCTFIIEDNDRSVDTCRADRRGHGQMIWPECVRRYHYKPVYPHAGSGCKFHIKFKLPANA